MSLSKNIPGSLKRWLAPTMFLIFLTRSSNCRYVGMRMKVEKSPRVSKKTSWRMYVCLKFKRFSRKHTGPWKPKYKISYFGLNSRMLWAMWPPQNYVNFRFLSYKVKQYTQKVLNNTGQRYLSDRAVVPKYVTVWWKDIAIAVRASKHTLIVFRLMFYFFTMFRRYIYSGMKKPKNTRQVRSYITLLFTILHFFRKEETTRRDYVINCARNVCIYKQNSLWETRLWEKNYSIWNDKPRSCNELP